MPHDQSSSVGGAYANLRRGDATSREFTGDDGVNRARIHGIAPPFRGRVGGLSAGPHDRWPTPYEPSLQYLLTRVLYSLSPTNGYSFLTYLKQNPIQEVQGQLFGTSQSHAHTWIHLLHAVLNQALAHQELLPARNADELAVMLAAKRTVDVPVSPFLA
jgi:hypothetical protein